MFMPGRRQERQSGPRPEEIRTRRRTAMRQLENVDLYLAAIENLQLDDAELDQAVALLRDDVHALRGRLARPRVV